MKKLILFLFILLPFLVTSQTTAPIRLAAKINVSVVTGSDPYNLTIAISDDLSRFTIADISNGDSVYLIDGSDLLIYVVTNRVGSVITVDDPLNTGIQPPTGQGAIISPTVERKYPTYISGLRDDLRSMIMNRFSQLVSKDIALQDEITEYVGISDVAPAVSASSHTGETWRNSVGELYYSNGASWLTDKEVRISATALSGSAGRYKFGIDTVGVDTMYINNNGTWRIFQVIVTGGSVAIPTNRIPYGTGIGITSTPAMRFDSVTSNGQYTQRILSVGDTVTNANRRIEAIEINNTYGRIGTGGLGRGWGYSPLKFRSPTKCTECTDFRFNHQTSTNQDYGGTPGDSTLNEVVKWGFNIDGAEKPSARGLWYAMEPNWYNGGQLWHEYHLEFYNPLFTQPSFTSLWGNFGTTRRLFTTEIQNSKSPTGMTNTWQFIGDSWLLRSLKSNTQYISIGFSEASRQGQLSVLTGRTASNGISMRADSASNLAALEKLGSNYSVLNIRSWDGFQFSDNLGRNAWSYLRSINDMSYGASTHNTLYSFNGNTVNGGYGVYLRFDKTGSPNDTRAQLNISGITNTANPYGIGMFTPTASLSDSNYIFHKFAGFKGMRFEGNRFFFGPNAASHVIHPGTSARMVIRADDSNVGTSGNNLAALRAENNSIGSTATGIVAYVAENLGKCLTLSNNTGASSLFRSTASPETVISGNPGDWCLVNASGVGRAYLKVSGTGNTGWQQISSNNITKIGTFQNTGNAKGLSISADSLMLHAATQTTPGAWNTGNQSFGLGDNLSNKKTIYNTSDGNVTTMFKYWNTAGSEGSGVGNQYFVGEGEIANQRALVATGGIGNQFITSLKDPSSTLVDAAIYTQGTNYSSTEFDAKQRFRITNVTAATYQVTGKDVVINVPTTATTTTITLPEIVSGVPGANQVRIGDEIKVIVNLSTSVTIQRAGTSDLIWRDGDTSGNTSLSTTGGTYYTKVFLAIGLNEWSVK